MTLQQFLLILRARYKVALLVFFITVATATALSLLLPKQYMGSAALVVDVKSPDPVSGMMLQGLMAPGYMATQIDIINSDRVARDVVRGLKLEQSPALREAWQDDTEGKGNIVDWIAIVLQKKLDVKPARESNLININYLGLSPEFAAAVANAFAQAYINVNLEMRLAPARQYATFFEEQTKAARAKLEEAQNAMSAYQQKNGITAADNRLDFETAKLNETSSQLTGVQGQTTDSQSKRQSPKADTISDVIQSPLINGLKSNIAQVEAKLNESSGNLGKNHPQTLRTEMELATLKAQLESETKKITSSIDTSYQVGKQREKELQSAVAAQKTRVLLLNKQRDELNVLQRDIDSAQRNFEAVSGRASQSNLESQTNQTNISVLNPAVPPAEPSKPRVFLNILVSIFLGGLLGLALALGLELRNRHVRSADDLAEVLDIPQLGTISSAVGTIKAISIGASA